MPDKSGSRARNVGASVRQRLLNLAYACGQPLEGLLTRDALELAAAWRELTNQDIAARIVGCICQAAIGDALLHDGDRLGRALQQLLTHQPVPNHTAALDIGAKRWSLCHVDLYGDLLERNAGEKKSGAGHRFTPRHVIDSIVTAMCPQLNDLIDDPRGRRAALATRKNIGATRRWRCFPREQIAQRGCKLTSAGSRTTALKLPTPSAMSRPWSLTCFRVSWAVRCRVAGLARRTGQRH